MTQRSLLKVVFLFTLCSTNLFGSDAQTLLAKAADATDIWSLGVPLQLDADITFMQMNSGTMQGSARFIWSPPNRWRREISAPGYSETVVNISGKSWRSASLQEIPIRVEELNWSLWPLAHLQKSGPFASAPAPNAEYKVEHRKVEGTEADCVHLTTPARAEIVCLSKDSGLPIAISDEYGTYEYADYKSFQTKSFASTIRTIEDTGQVFEVHLKLSQQPTPDNTFTPPKGALEDPALAVKVSGGVLESVLVSKKDPIYPAAAKRNREQGIVRFNVIIAKDGRVKFLHIIQSAGANLDQSAYEAVSEWKYKPYSLGGVPVEVHSEVTINFTLSGG